MRACFIAAIFVSAALLFTVQPFTGKLLLPLAGGSPQVWNTCMVFFQGALLAGYLYAHAIARLPIKVQAMIHLCVLAGAALVLPVDVAAIAASEAPAEGAPAAWLLGVLVKTVGLPFFAVSTSSPLLQSWFAKTRDPRAKDPYFLYVASNAGSVVGLLAYPAIIEPLMTRQDQASGWTGGYGLFFLLIAGCMTLAIASTRRPGASPEASAPAPVKAQPITWSRRFFWLALAFVPSSLMLGVTQYISTDLAAVPLLWVAPLLLYLVSFMLAFSTLRVSASLLGRVTPLVVAIMALVLLSQSREPVVLIVAIHIVGFLVLAWMCHRRLAEDRPDPAHLTEFYLMMSIGGVLGGAFNALVAPSIFIVVAEYPLAIAAACFLTPQFASDVRALWGKKGVWRGVLIGSTVVGAVLVLVAVLAAEVLSQQGAFKKAPLVSPTTAESIARGGVPVVICLVLLLWRGTPRFGVAIAGAMFVAPYLATLGDIHIERTFFGVHRVKREVGTGWVLHHLYHGTTLHGVQYRMDMLGEPGALAGPELNVADRDAFLFDRSSKAQGPALLARRARYQIMPTTYYHPRGPIGDVMQMLIEGGRLKQAAFVGMGAGTLAAYAQPGSTFVYYEIDPAVKEIAHNPAYFTYISDAVRDPSVRIGTILGDGRRTITIEQPGVGPFDLIVVDAFSSDSIPVHLITREAIQAYFKRTNPNGLVAFHISNRYFDLSPVLARIALEEGLVSYIRNDPDEDGEEQKRDSLWVVLARSKDDLGVLATKRAMWLPMGSDASDPLWTDDYSNVLGVFVPLRDVFGRKK